MLESEYPASLFQSPVQLLFNDCILKGAIQIILNLIELNSLSSNEKRQKPTDKCLCVIMTFIIIIDVLSSSPGWDHSSWSWCGLRLVPSAVLVGWQTSSRRSSGHPALLCVICVPLLPPRLLLALIGHLLCSQVGQPITNSFQVKTFNWSFSWQWMWICSDVRNWNSFEPKPFGYQPKPSTTRLHYLPTND